MGPWCDQQGLGRQDGGDAGAKAAAERGDGAEGLLNGLSCKGIRCLQSNRVTQAWALTRPPVCLWGGGGGKGIRQGARRTRKLFSGRPCALPPDRRCPAI